MKIAVECQSPLLQKSLEIFLSKYLSSPKKSDIIIRDVECLNDSKCFYIASNQKADLLKPFSKAQLILALEKRYNQLYPSTIESDSVEAETKENKTMDFQILQDRIELLTKEYQENIIRAVKAFYEK